ncbi:uncharacterized protein EDB91DRAFT_1241823 [Suillus paluster]|uniref:uncharacterized protein n=1 Tax=Suillus paluster TaxID=48578 RepID=UPI001B874BAC|nr:uncharacterized protein EDB91DRAFT_1241823 [Suillus paluster]KAG1756775.1 hypothetical protein EDB91DRAFT_1241823 [Suillus paluster]
MSRVAIRDSADSKASTSKRRPSKRRLVDSDEEEFDDAAADRFEPPRVKRSRTAELEPTPHEHNDVEHDMDVDVDGELDADEETRFLGHDASDQFTATAPVAPGQARKKSKADVSAKRLKRAGSGTGAKKKKQVVFSDAEDAEVDIDDLVEEDDFLDEPFPDAEDDDFELETAPKRGGKAKASSTKSKPAKAKPVLTKGSKAKAGKEKEKEKEIMIKDERKIPPSGIPSLQASELFVDNESSAHPSSAVDPSAAPDQSTLPPPELKKRKLPTIKKNKPPASAATSSQSQSIASKPPPSTDDVTKIGAAASQQRKAAGLMGAADFDLRDKSVYAELFKGAGGSTPRSGLNRKEKEEERRKELSKMRDEAKAKRAEEAKHFFDLQSQADKIAGFEQKFRAPHNGVALHPNFLAAKFREEYDKERARLRHGRERSLSATKEEGEA